MRRIAIAGGPRTGKTTLAQSLWMPGDKVLHTDDLIHLHLWSEASQVVCGWFDEPGPWIIEGVTVSRALRKWHQQHPGQPPPLDKCIYLTKEYVPLNGQQSAMAIGIEVVHAEIEHWLWEHGCG